MLVKLNDPSTLIYLGFLVDLGTIHLLTFDVLLLTMGPSFLSAQVI